MANIVIPNRNIADVIATRSKVPVLIGIAGASSSGKTFSALRLASGIQEVNGGDIYVIDTESGRAKHYADDFKFRHVPFGEPYGSLDYMAYAEHCVDKKAGVVIIDSMSHEHEGNGGHLDMHETEMDRLQKAWGTPRDATQFAAWALPKTHRKMLLNFILNNGSGTAFILCYRAKEKYKQVKRQNDQGRVKSVVEPMGFMPIGGDEFVYEMNLNCLLLPNSKGYPTWRSDEIGEKMMMKLPRQFEHLFPMKDGNCTVQLSQQIGKEIALWAEGKPGITTSEPVQSQNGANGAEPAPAVATDWGKLYKDAVKARWPEDTKTCHELWISEHPGLTSNKLRYQWLSNPENAIELDDPFANDDEDDTDPFGENQPGSATEDAAGAEQSGELFAAGEVETPKEYVKEGAAAS